MFVSGSVRVVFVSGCVWAVFCLQKYPGSVCLRKYLGGVCLQTCPGGVFLWTFLGIVPGHVQVVFVSGQHGSRRVRAVFLSGREFISGLVRMGVCFRMCLSSVCVQTARLQMRAGCFCLRTCPGRVYSMTGRESISDILLFLSSLLFDAESF